MLATDCDMIDLHICTVAIQCVWSFVNGYHGNGNILDSPDEFFFSLEYTFDG